MASLRLGRYARDTCGNVTVSTEKGHTFQLSKYVDRRSSITRDQLIHLSSGGSKRIFNRRVHVIVPLIMNRRPVDHDVSMGRHREPDVHFEACAVTMFVRSYHLHATTCNTLIVRFQPPYFTKDLRARSI